jgi:hypothetical protein
MTAIQRPVDKKRQLSVRTLARIADVDAERWDACAGSSDPFLSHAFLATLEDSGSACADEGWMPHHLVCEDASGRVVGCAPLYVKGHSYGEYVFDWSWASAYRRAGREYYPKLQCCVPFTPVGGSRLMVLPGEDAAQIRGGLASAVVQLTDLHQLSSAHITFLSEEELAACNDVGMLSRVGIQYHWHNQGYASFDDFLGALIGRKRKAIKKERKSAHETGLHIRPLVGADISERHWDAFYRFYVGTIGRKWGSPYLTREFFTLLGERLGDRVVLVVAESDGDPVAGALNLRGEHALYGRYWGCTERHRFLHFELCYHQAIELAIAWRLARVEAGAQGEHKIQRGYVPVPTFSAHYIRDPRFRRAIADFLAEERPAVRREIDTLMAESPFSADRAATGPRPP